ncbi:MAG TPA: O-antigen ligase family protein, partial [Lachnospiraceae bacterium]|nr:O-antigen ligase family protein [Lachnospiraceae bacterium]
MSSTKKTITGAEASSFIVRILVSAYTILLFILLPLCYRNNYFDIGDFKYELFFNMTGCLFILLVPALLFYLFTHIHSKTGNTRTVKQFFSDLSVIDRFVLLYLAACLITFFLSPYNTWTFFTKDASNPAWDGYDGWCMGLKSQLMFIALYFLVSRFFIKSWKADLLASILGASSIVFLLGILHRFLIDPLALYEGIDSSYHILFLSTIGQATWYSSYLCTVFPIGLFLFWYSDKPLVRILTGIYTAIGFASLVTQNSDSAFLAMAAFLVLLFALSFQSAKYLQRFLEILLICGLSMRVIGVLQLAFPDRAVPLETLSVFLSQNPLLWIILFIIALLYFALASANARDIFKVEKVRFIRTLGFILLAVVIPLVVLCIVLTTTGHLPSWLSALKNYDYMIFNENWGNGRGFTWKYSASMFAEYPLKLKLFGIGSDCFASYTYDYHAADVSVKWGDSILANAHNEWFNMLLTTGIFGLFAYAGIFISAFVIFIKEKEKDLFLTAAAACIISYIFHNLF